MVEEQDIGCEVHFHPVPLLLQFRNALSDLCWLLDDLRLDLNGLLFFLHLRWFRAHSRVLRQLAWVCVQARSTDASTRSHAERVLHGACAHCPRLLVRLSSRIWVQVRQVSLVGRLLLFWQHVDRVLEVIHSLLDSALELLRQLVLVVDTSGHLLHRYGDFVAEGLDFSPVLGEIREHVALPLFQITLKIVNVLVQILHLLVELCHQVLRDLNAHLL